MGQKLNSLNKFGVGTSHNKLNKSEFFLPIIRKCILGLRCKINKK